MERGREALDPVPARGRLAMPSNAPPFAAAVEPQAAR
jgi:hypothetical protein